MNIHGNKEKFNYDPSLRPLFDAMAAGEIITSVVCMAGTMNKDDRSKDFEITNFKAADYWIGLSSSGTTENDYVDIDNTDRMLDERQRSQRIDFYMGWVISFEFHGRVVYNAQHTNPKNYNCASTGTLDDCKYPACVCHQDN